MGRKCEHGKVGHVRCSRKPVQVQLTEYATDSFPLPIELKSLTLMNTGESTAQNNLPRKDHPNGLASRNMPEARHPMLDGKRKAPRFQTVPSGLIGATCLSIIGMIEPGRTVRLYRQIH
jgi:hypothetical protein